MICCEVQFSMETLGEVVKGAGVRLLGVPCVRGRVVQATLKHLLEPILDPVFSDY